MSREVTRRAVLGAGVGALGGCCAVPEVPGPNERNEVVASASVKAPGVSSASIRALVPSAYDTIVIGAGMAGVAAARALVDEGQKVVVLEARERLGGRIWTDRTLGAPLDMGAAWIHGHRGNPLVELARKQGAETQRSDWGDMALLHEGSRVPPEQAAKAQEGYRRRLRQATKAAQKGADRPLAEALGKRPAGQEGALQSWSERLHALDLGDDPSRVSLRHGDDDEEYPGDDLVLKEGFGPLVEHLAKGLEVKLGHEVKSIERDRSLVTVRTEVELFQAPRVVVTLPLGVLKGANGLFRPALPAAKRGAIQRMGFGNFCKVALAFPEVRWPGQDFFGFTEPGGPLVVVNAHRWTGKPLLVALASGEQARLLLSQGEPGARERCLKALRSLEPRLPEPRRMLVADWSRDPFAGGSYSFAQLGSSDEDHEELARPVDNQLFFAGEATILRSRGTVHGALASGRREAQRILALR